MEEVVSRPLAHNALFFFVMIGVLVFANWGTPGTWDVAPEGGPALRVDVVEAPFDPHEAGAVYRLRPEGADPNGAADVRMEATQFLAHRQPAPGLWTTLWANKWLVTAGFAAALSLILVFWFGVRWWKIALTAVPPAVLGLVLPAGGLWVLIPFSAAIVGRIDAYQEISPAAPSVILQTAREALEGGCAGCAVPVGVFKAMQVAAGLALPKDINIRLTKEQ